MLLQFAKVSVFTQRVLSVLYTIHTIDAIDATVLGSIRLVVRARSSSLEGPTVAVRCSLWLVKICSQKSHVHAGLTHNEFIPGKWDKYGQMIQMIRNDTDILKLIS